MNGGYVMLDFAGVSTGTNAELANKITKAVTSGKLIIGCNINGQTPVVMVADSNGVLHGGDVTVSVSGTTVTVTELPTGAVVSDILKISATKSQAITASGMITASVTLTVPTGYEIIGVGKIMAKGVGDVIELALRGWQQTSGGITIYFSNPGSSTGTANIDVDVIVAKIKQQASREFPEPEDSNRKAVSKK